MFTNLWEELNRRIEMLSREAILNGKAGDFAKMAQCHRAKRELEDFRNYLEFQYLLNVKYPN